MERISGMMKKGWSLLIVCVSVVALLFVGGKAAAAVSGKVVSANNEYGGKTVEKVYAVTKGKKAKKAKIQKDITYFDGKGKKVKVESLYTAEHATGTGAEKRIAYFDAKGELTKMEKYFTESYGKLRGIDKMVVYYDLKKKQPKTEYYKDSKLVPAPK
jgi:hypothetical protein